MSKQIYFDAMKEKGQAGCDRPSGRVLPKCDRNWSCMRSDGKIPSFAAAVARKNMLERKVGFVCRSTAGRVVKLLQNYDSTVHPGSRGSAGAVGLPVVHGSEKRRCLSSLWNASLRQRMTAAPMTAMYGVLGRITMWAPGTAGAKWNDLGEIEEVMEAG